MRKKRFKEGVMASCPPAGRWHSIIGVRKLFTVSDLTEHTWRTPRSNALTVLFLSKISPGGRQDSSARTLNHPSKEKSGNKPSNSYFLEHLLVCALRMLWGQVQPGPLVLWSFCLVKGEKEELSRTQRVIPGGDKCKEKVNRGSECC